MGLFLIIESDEKASQQIQTAVSSLDAQAVFKTYLNLEAFYKEEAEKKTTEAVSLLVIEFTGKKIHEWQQELTALKAHFLSAENPEINQDIQVLMTSFDDAALEHRKLLDLPVYNFIFKPFDELILKESLNAALTFKKKLSTIDLKSTKSSSSIGILKDIELVSVSEMGFVTFSDIKLPEGSVSKYFCSIFSYNKKQSAWAQCLHSFPHPTKENTFVNKYQFFGVESAFLMSIRKYVAAQKLRKTHEFVFDLSSAPNLPAATIRFGIMATQLEAASKLQEEITKHFKNVEVELIYFTQVADLASRTNLRTFDTILNLTDVLPVDFSKLFKAGALHFWLNTVLKDDEERKELSEFYKDLIYAPLDRSYLYKKLKLHHAQLVENEPSSYMTVTCFEKMKSANLLKISEISEVDVTFNYTRELIPKTHREFIFLAEDETNLVELPAFCHFVEPAQGEKGKFVHQFVFFGMTDHYLKQIRLWLTHDYILKNQKEK